MILRIFLWNIADSKTTLAELRSRLPALMNGDVWISNDAGDRFGLVTFADRVPAAMSEVRDVIGRDPDVAEEFEVEA